MLKDLVYRLSALSARHPRRVLVMAATLSVLSLVASMHLPVYTSRQALLPQDTEVAQRLNLYLESFGASSDLVVALEKAPRENLEEFASLLAERLQSAPEVAQATDRIDTAFLKSHLYLLLPKEQLQQIRGLMEKASSADSSDLSTLIRQAEDLKLPAFGPEVNISEVGILIDAVNALIMEWERFIEAPASPQPELKLQGLMKALGAEQIENGYFSSRKGDMLLVFIHARAKGEDFETLEPFNRRIQETAEKIRQEFKTQGKTAPEWTLTGLPAIEYEEYIDIGRDIQLVIWTAALLIGALIFLVVRSPTWALAIFVPMGLGALWSLGFAYLSVGHLTIITSSFLAILFGLGADYGIFTTSQIAIARQSGKSLLDAISTGIAESFPAVATAGGASILIFGTLATVEFPGFAELGIIAAGGVLLIMISTWMVQPAIYALFPPKIKQPVSKKTSQGPSRRLNPILAVSVVLLALVAAALGIFKGGQIGFDYDVLSLLPKDSKAALYQRRLVVETDYQSEVVIFTAKTLEEIRRMAHQAEALPSIAKVQSIAPFFPEDRNDRSLEAREISRLGSNENIRKNLDSLQTQGISDDAQERLITLIERGIETLDTAEESAFSAGHKELVGQIETLRTHLTKLLKLLKGDFEGSKQATERYYSALVQATNSGLSILKSWGDAKDLAPEDLPDGIREKFLAPDGTFAAYAYPAKSVYDPVNLDQLMREVYGVSAQATGFPSTHQVFSKAVVTSFTQGTRAAIVVCLLWLIVALRKPKNILMAALPLVMGGGWMLGIQYLGDLRYNYANIIALPLVIALAVDYGVWLSHRWSSIREQGPYALALDAGRVILLAAGTELAGLGAITLASYRGVSGLGIDITIGLGTCLIATLIVTPVIGQLLHSSRKKTRHHGT